MFEVISTVGDLVEESRKMGHFASAFSEEAVAGRAIFFRGVIKDNPVTVQLELVDGGGRFRLVEAAGYGNRHLDQQEMGLIRDWVASLPD